MATNGNIEGPARQVDGSQPLEVDRAIGIINAAFSTTALTTSFICEIDNTPSPYPSPAVIDAARRRKHFHSGIHEIARAGAVILEAGEWSAVALWEPPGFQGKPFSELKRETLGPIRSEWRDAIKRAKAAHLGFADSSETKDALDPRARFRPFYHLSFLARNPDKPSVHGAISAIIEPYLEKARVEHVPAWLEATTPHAVAIYEHFGFHVVEEVTSGAGHRDENGWPQEGGPGVIAWCMIYDSHASKRAPVKPG